jgi:hypothetical protein
MKTGALGLFLTVLVWTHCFPTPDKFYKRRSQEKTLQRWLELFLLLSPLDGAGSVLTARARCSVAGHCGPVI